MKVIEKQAQSQLQFISKNLSHLPACSDLMVADEKLADLLEKMLCNLHYNGEKHSNIDFIEKKSFSSFYKKSSTRNNSTNERLLKFRIGYKHFPEFDISLDINTCQRFYQIIKCYGVFYREESPMVEYGLIATTTSTDKTYPRDIYSFLVIVIPTDIDLVYSISIEAIDYQRVNKKHFIPNNYL